MPTPTVNVSIIRKRWTGADWITHLLTFLITLFAYGGLVSLVLADIGGLPDLGYIESVNLVLLARLLFATSTYREWTTEEAK
ncbi:hypothetical protein [Isoptericola sp. NPDC056605]|uniref:hypothetical protein n=1 Tax=Isoptericola sp. NPDC056605 TaxID=3345876 RepID=UPI0036C9A765